MAKDPYSILGVPRTATADEIKRAYRELAKKYHPDRNRNDSTAEERFKEVQAAYEVLGDAERRAQYDRFGEGGPSPDYVRWRSGNAGPGAGGMGGAGPSAEFITDFGDLSSIIEQFFRRGGAGAGPAGGARRGTRSHGASSAAAGAGFADSEAVAALEYPVEISLEEVAHGTSRSVVLTSGNRSEEIRVKIPPAVRDGQRIRVAGKGNFGTDGRGDLMILCRVLPHAWFRREELNLLIDVPVAIWEALLGAQIELPTLGGERVVLKVPPGTSSGAKLRLRERGLHDPRTGRTGDLLAVVRIETPKTISANVRRIAEELRAEDSSDVRAGLGWSNAARGAR
ncbi:MAG: DnaJ C-terminal domain-containing protein [Phycisphaerae bacterium]|nr:DnaJ C-terminal domain-containing protein [Phycisphaerae bacterium]